MAVLTQYCHLHSDLTARAIKPWIYFFRTFPLLTWAREKAIWQGNEKKTNNVMPTAQHILLLDFCTGKQRNDTIKRSKQEEQLLRWVLLHLGLSCPGHSGLWQASCAGTSPWPVGHHCLLTSGSNHSQNWAFSKYYQAMLALIFFK